MIGLPLGPSQQSSSTQRTPLLSTRRYMWLDESDSSWSPVRYVLCEVEIQ